MERVEQLRNHIAQLYEARHPDRAEWADWIFESHVLPVADAARTIAETYGGRPELAEAAGLLHDVADAIMKREDPRHEERSFDIARELLATTGFSEEEIGVIVDDAIAKHSCYGDIRPGTLEGKAMAAGDAVVHLTTDFYKVCEQRRFGLQSSQELASWALAKIDRDFFNKIPYDDLRAEVRPDYERLKLHFQNLKNE